MRSTISVLFYSCFSRVFPVLKGKVYDRVFLVIGLTSGSALAGWLARRLGGGGWQRRLCVWMAAQLCPRP